MEAYSTKSCIEMLESSDPQFSGVWNTIWKIRLPHKIQLFLWKLEAGALPTNESLHVRLGEEFSKECPRCRGVIESSNHIVWNSLEAKSIWNMVANWWALNTMQRSKLGNSLKDTLSILKKNHLFSLHLERKNHLFSLKIKQGSHSMVYLVKEK